MSTNEEIATAARQMFELLYEGARVTNDPVLWHNLIDGLGEIGQKNLAHCDKMIANRKHRDN